MTPRLIAAVAGLALLVTACGAKQVDAGKLERTIRSVASSQLGIAVTGVKCPGNVKLQKGQVTVCQTTFATGETEPFAVTQTDKGNLEIRPTAVIAGRAEKEIAARLARRGVKATVACPRHVAIRAGATFACTATVPTGRSAQVTATITDNLGNYTLPAI